jgi:hypothetical protein
MMEDMDVRDMPTEKIPGVVLFFFVSGVSAR